MNSLRTLSRRNLLHRAAVTGIAIFGAAVLPAARGAFATSGPGQYISQYNGVRIRDSYGLSSNIIGILNVGDVVNITGDSFEADGYTWITVTVTATGTKGWTALEFFEPVLGVIIWPAGTAVHVNSDNVNLRTAPGVGSSVIDSYDTGANATIRSGPEQATGYYWYEISIAGIRGWMAADFLTDGEGSSSGGGDTGWPAWTFVTPTTSLNLRTGAGTGNGVIDVYGPGDGATILAGPQSANGYSWYQVEMASDSNVGWFAGKYLELARTEPTGARLRVVDGPLNFRNDPSLSADIIESFPTGTVVVIIDASFVRADGHTWMHVSPEGRSQYVGWIAQGFTEEI